MSTVPSVMPWLMSASLPRLDAGNTWMSYLPFVRFLISSAAHTEYLWNGSEVSYTCAHLSLVCAPAMPAVPSAVAARVQAAMAFRVLRLLLFIGLSPLYWLKEMLLAMSGSFCAAPARAESLVRVVHVDVHCGARGLGVVRGHRVANGLMLCNGRTPRRHRLEVPTQPREDRSVARVPEALHRFHQHGIAAGR